MDAGSGIARASPEPLMDPVRDASSGRYRLSGREGKSFIVSRGSPNVTLVLDRGMVYSQRRVRAMPPGCVFLDGAAAGPPRYDNERRHYSLDHHAGCVRSFTLSTCEQAAVVLYQGLPLSDGTWSIFVNGIDLDSILAAWLLMNHTELLAADRRLFRKAMPLVRVEGSIDAHGLGASVLTGLPADVLEGGEQELADLGAALKDSSTASDLEAGRIVLSALSALDELVIPNESMAELLSYDELARVRIASSGLAILAGSKNGIYEAESFFKARLGDALGLLILYQGEGRYTVRLVNRFLKRDLSRLYAYLNRRDPAVYTSREAGENRWGGSSNIGGSPRLTGSSLSPEAVADAVERVYGDSSSIWKRAVARFRRLSARG